MQSRHSGERVSRRPRSEWDRSEWGRGVLEGGAQPARGVLNGARLLHPDQCPAEQGPVFG